MGYASWLTPSKLSGSGNDTVNVSANANNTGRNARTTNITFSAVGVEDVVRTVSQTGKPEFGTFNNPSAASEKTGGTLTLSGTSNSAALTFSKGTDNIGLTIPATYTAAGTTTNNGDAITGDPGATQEYAWSIQFTIPANAGVDPLTCQIVVTDDAGHTSTCTITLAAGDATLSVTPASVEIPWDGSTSASFTVTSNTNWTIA
jgi:hypothetical protein